MRIPKIIAFKVTFFEKLVFPFQRSLTYKYTDAYIALLSVPELLEVFMEPVYLSCIFCI